MEILRILTPFIAIAYIMGLFWLGIRLFTKWFPLIKNVEDPNTLSFADKLRFFYVRMICEVGVIFILVLSGASKDGETARNVEKYMWRGNWIFPLLIIVASLLLSIPLTILAF